MRITKTYKLKIWFDRPIYPDRGDCSRFVKKYNIINFVVDIYKNKYLLTIWFSPLQKAKLNRLLKVIKEQKLRAKLFVEESVIGEPEEQELSLE